MDRFVKGKVTPGTTLKDVNYLTATTEDPNFLSLKESDRSRLLRVVKADADFLSSQGLMDYSLLLGIETLKDEQESVEVHQIGAKRRVSAINYEQAE